MGPYGGETRSTTSWWNLGTKKKCPPVDGGLIGGTVTHPLLRLSSNR